MIRVWEFNSRWGLGIFSFSTAFRLHLGPTRPPIQWVLGALSLDVKWQGHAAVPPHFYLVPNSRIHGAIPPPQYVFMAWCLIHQSDNFTFIIHCRAPFISFLSAPSCYFQYELNRPPSLILDRRTKKKKRKMEASKSVTG
jgi:hypothetical protein